MYSYTFLFCFFRDIEFSTVILYNEKNIYIYFNDTHEAKYEYCYINTILIILPLIRAIYCNNFINYACMFIIYLFSSLYYKYRLLQRIILLYYEDFFILPLLLILIDLGFIYCQSLHRNVLLRLLLSLIYDEKTISKAVSF